MDSTEREKLMQRNIMEFGNCCTESALEKPVWFPDKRELIHMFIPTYLASYGLATYFLCCLLTLCLLDTQLKV